MYPAGTGTAPGVPVLRRYTARMGNAPGVPRQGANIFIYLIDFLFNLAQLFIILLFSYLFIFIYSQITFVLNYDYFYSCVHF